MIRRNVPIRRATAVAAAVALLWLPGGAPSRAAEDAFPVLMAAGDVSECEEGRGRDERVSDLVMAEPDAHVAAVGDLSQDEGTPQQYAECYGEGWGRFKDRTRPAPGNHDFENEEGGVRGAGYFAYFGANAGEPGKGYYAYDLGGWRLYAINSNCGSVGGCSADSPMVEWLRADLAAHQSECIMAYWHHPRFSSPAARPDESFADHVEDKKSEHIWAALYDAGADVVLNGHRAVYERFARQDNQARPDPRGIRQFISGTGGASVNFHNEVVAPNSQVRHDNLGGVLRFTLRPDGYDWRFVNEDRSPGAFTDAGSDTCGVAATEAPVGFPPATPTKDVTAPATPTKDGTAPTTTAPEDATPGEQPGGTARPGSGYWLVTGAGTVYAFGDAPHHGDSTGPVVDMVAEPGGRGYWLVDRAGQVTARGGAANHGNLDPSRLRPGEAVTSLSATPSGQGYWFFTDRGRVVPAGDARPYGDMSGVALNGPVLDSVATPSGRGYYMVASDGGVFAFGDAAFAGSMGATALNAPVESLVPDPDLGGYWLVASDGGVFAFDAPFRGSMGGVALNAPVTGMVTVGDGYLMVASDGGVFNFSDVPFAGSLGGDPPDSPVVAVSPVSVL